MKRLFFLFGAWMVFGSSISLSAQTVTLAYVDFPPYEFEENNQPKGALVQIVQTIFQRINIPLNLVNYPFKRAFEETKNGNIDGLFNFYKTEERLPYFDYSDAVILNPLVLFVHKDSELEFKGALADLRGKNVGAMLGYTYGSEFDATTLFSIDRAHSHEANFKKLVINRIDIYPCDKLVGLYVLSKEKLLPDVKILPTPLKIMEGHIAFTKNKHNGIILKINRVIKEMKEKNEIEQIINEYMAKVQGF